LRILESVDERTLGSDIGYWHLCLLRLAECEAWMRAR
jgi:hypothetical protein